MPIINAFPSVLQNGTIEDAAQVMTLFSWVQSQTNGGAAPATIGSSVLKGDGAGGTTIAIPDIDYASTSSAVPIGTIIDYAGTGVTSVPAGYFPCDGRAISRTGFSLLFSKIGTKWGAGDGVTTFNIPNTAGRTAVFYGFGAGTGTGPGSGTVISVSVITANGFAGTVANPQVNAQITLTTTINGVLKGAGGALAAALNVDLPRMTATQAGAVPTPPNSITQFLRGDGQWVNPGFASILDPTFLGTLQAPRIIATNTDNATSPIAAPLRSAGGMASAGDTWVGGDLHVVGNILQQASQPGADVGSSVSNADSTNPLSSSSVYISTWEGTGDPTVQFTIQGTLDHWLIGLDNSDNNNFKIGRGPALGFGEDFFIISAASGDVVVNTGNLVLNKTGGRIIGNFSAGAVTLADRVMFQSIIPGGATNVEAIPNGAGNIASFNVNSNSDPTNGSRAQLVVLGGIATQLNSTRRGTAPFLPLSIQTSDLDRITVGVAGETTFFGDVIISGSARRIQADFSDAVFGNRLHFQSNVLNGATTITAMPNGTNVSSGWVANNTSDPNNCTAGALTCNATGVLLSGLARGTGSLLPIIIGFPLGVSEMLRCNTNGLVSITTCFGRGAPVIKNADFTVGINENVLLVTKAGSICTVVLPAPASFIGREITVVNQSTFGVISSAGNVMNRIGTATSNVITGATQGAWTDLMSNGTVWNIVRSG